ncbi:MAG: neutral/alkaline non-lysosomal ceramidase N-terminal domain-containing protein, partial [Candidatus Hydrogenedentes bacterium]|nr:neutral/alkaline non-lysosomal ceramidase N-terminal domain-containing protein [Candidatus Hydrogenedentota bacterium]
MKLVLRLCVCVLIAVGMSGVAGAEGLKVGAGRIVITPEQPIWLAGYAARTEPSQGKLHDIFAKALAVEDETGARTVIVTTDLVGLPASISRDVAKRVESDYGIPRERLALTASHTHSAPVLRDNLRVTYDMSPEQWSVVEAYSDKLKEQLVEVIGLALKDLEPGNLRWGIGEADFAKNRRKYTLDGVINDFNPIGPVDHDVPVLVARRPDSSIKAVLFGYACHNTVLALQQISGDYAGFAQAYVEKELPGTTALFFMGCGGDQNPIPRRTVELAQQYGEELGKAVVGTVGDSSGDVHGPIRAAYKEIPLKFAEVPTREKLVELQGSSDVYQQRLAKLLLEKLDKQGSLDATYPYPIQVWQFADT